MDARIVSLLRCDSYTPKVLEEKILQSLANIGFDLSVFSKARVGLKPNLLIPSAVEKAIITHPEFFRAMVKIVKASGGSPVLIESPSIHSLSRTLKKTPYGAVVEAEGVEVSDVEKTRTLRYGQGKKFKQVDVSAAYFDVDLIVNLPKFKTHGLTYMTGAVKNLFGAIPGIQKSKMHVKLPSADEFSEFLLDLYGAMETGFGRKDALVHIMDAIMAQEKEGPGASGTPKAMNAILAGLDAVAVDCVAVTAAGLDLDRALTVAKGFERGFGVKSAQEIVLAGDPMASLGISALAPSRGSLMSNMVRWPLTTRWFKTLVLDHPQPREGVCTLCYQCKKICPAQAISEAGKGKKTPAYDYGACIRCYCCMEVCPEAAIRRAKGSLQWLFRL